MFELVMLWEIHLIQFLILPTHVQLITKSKHGLLASSQITQPCRSGGPLDSSQISAVSRSRSCTRATRHHQLSEMWINTFRSQGKETWVQLPTVTSSVHNSYASVSFVAYQIAGKEKKSKREADMAF